MSNLDFLVRAYYSDPSDINSQSVAQALLRERGASKLDNFICAPFSMEKLIEIDRKFGKPVKNSYDEFGFDKRLLELNCCMSLNDFFNADDVGSNHSFSLEDYLLERTLWFLIGDDFVEIEFDSSQVICMFNNSLYYKIGFTYVLNNSENYGFQNFEDYKNDYKRQV